MKKLFFLLIVSILFILPSVLGQATSASYSIKEPDPKPSEKNLFEKNINILSYTPKNNNKIEVKDFVNHFKKRFESISEILQKRLELDNLVSIDKISGSRQGISIIGMVYSKVITKNKNIILEVEDLTGKIKILVSKLKEDIYKIAEEICLDSVLGFRCSGNNEILFANKIFFPDS